MRKVVFSAFLVLVVASLARADAPKQELPKNVSAYLQDVSVTIHASRSQGSGTIVTRDGINYVWTAGHVVDGLRRTRDIVDPKTGSRKTVVEFDDAQVVKELVEDGRKVGEYKMDAEIVRFSNFETGEDLALLRLRKKSFIAASAVFYLDDKIPELGTKLLHCGSLLGQMGSNSMTSGIMSKAGRVFSGIVYDQTTCTAFPGSSGGGVYLEDGRYVGMVVRGAGEGFNLIVPQRRLAAYARKVGVEFAIDPSKPHNPDDIKKFPIEDESPGGSKQPADERKDDKAYRFLIAK